MGQLTEASAVILSENETKLGCWDRESCGDQLIER
jgi:hypothetical protein